MAKTINDDKQSINMIGAGTTIKGDIQSNGDFRIDGSLIGSVNSKGKIVIGETGNVEGEVVCKNADISGKLKAQITVSELLTLKATALLTGEITTSKLSIEPGAKFSGTCNMSDPSKSAGIEKPVSNESFRGKEKST
ncbi:MAG: polymer-forming cytoskeletal protein [Bacteroidales bacterium]|nr:polymer-forming cytoskeletal protein [Bacteroidales bacterium]